MARKRTVLSPAVPRATRAKAAAPETPAERVLLPGTRYRLRLTERRPEGGFPEPTYSDDLPALRELQGGLEWDGVESVLEELVGPQYVMADRRRALTVEELAKRGLARERTLRLPSKVPGEFRDETRWEISPEGQEELRRAARG